MRWFSGGYGDAQKRNTAKVSKKPGVEIVLGNSNKFTKKAQIKIYCKSVKSIANNGTIKLDYPEIIGYFDLVKFVEVDGTYSAKVARKSFAGKFVEFLNDNGDKKHRIRMLNSMMAYYQAQHKKWVEAAKKVEKVEELHSNHSLAQIDDTVEKMILKLKIEVEDGST